MLTNVDQDIYTTLKLSLLYIMLSSTDQAFTEDAIPSPGKRLAIGLILPGGWLCSWSYNSCSWGRGDRELGIWLNVGILVVCVHLSQVGYKVRQSWHLLFMENEATAQAIKAYKYICFNKKAFSSFYELYSQRIKILYRQIG